MKWEDGTRYTRAHYGWESHRVDYLGRWDEVEREALDLPYLTPNPTEPRVSGFLFTGVEKGKHATREASSEEVAAYVWPTTGRVGFLLRLCNRLKHETNTLEQISGEDDVQEDVVFEGTVE